MKRRAISTPLKLVYVIIVIDERYHCNEEEEDDEKKNKTKTKTNKNKNNNIKGGVNDLFRSRF